MKPLTSIDLDHCTLMEIAIIFALIAAGRWVERVGHEPQPGSFASRELARRSANGR